VVAEVVKEDNVYPFIPAGAAVRDMIIDPQTPGLFYVGTGGGVFKSTNGGASWSARSPRMCR